MHPPTIKSFPLPCARTRAMSKLEDLADRVERLLLRRHELQRTNVLLEQQLSNITGERDNLRSRLNAARTRIDMLLDRLPADAASAEAPSALLPATNKAAP